MCRDCDLGSSDIDLSIDLQWWKNKNNSQLLTHALQQNGFIRTGMFDKNGFDFGYEECWWKNDIKVEIHTT